MKSNCREERTIFRSIRCARIHGSVMNGWDSHSATCIQDLSPRPVAVDPARTFCRLPRAWRHLRPTNCALQPTINLGRKLTIVMAARAITHKIEYVRWRYHTEPA